MNMKPIFFALVAGGEFSVNVAKGNDNRLFVGQPDGGFGISQRC